MRIRLRTHLARWATPVAVVAIVALAAANVQAQTTYNWLGTSGTSTATAANWDGGVLPPAFTGDYRYANFTGGAIAAGWPYAGKPIASLAFGAGATGKDVSVDGAGIYKAISLGGGYTLGGANTLRALTIASTGNNTLNNSDTDPAGSCIDLSLNTSTVTSTDGTLTINKNITGVGPTKGSYHRELVFNGTGSIVQGTTSVISNTLLSSLTPVPRTTNTTTADVFVQKLGTGTLTLQGNNTFNGVFSVEAGTVVVKSVNALGNAGDNDTPNHANNYTNNCTSLYGGKLQIDLAAGATINERIAFSLGTSVLENINGDNTLSSVVFFYSGATIGANGGSLTINNGIGNVGTSGARHIVVGGIANTTINGNIMASGGSLTKAQSGTLTLNGTHNGTLDVQEGTMNLVGTVTGAGAVSADATLNAQGTVSGLLTVNGNLSAGQSPGFLDAAGGLDLNAGSVTTFEIAGLTRGTQYDAIDTTDLTINGAKPFQIDLATGVTLEAGDSFELIHFTGDLTGALDINSFVFNDAADMYAWALEDTDGGTVTISVVPEPSTIAACLMIGLALVGYRVTRRRRS